MTTLTVNDVAEFITNAATEEDLDDVVNAVKARQKALRNLRAMDVKPGVEVTLTGLSPKYLNGLSGTVQEGGRGQRVDVLLDSASTQRLARQGSKFHIDPDAEEYLLTGVPASTCQAQK